MMRLFCWIPTIIFLYGSFFTYGQNESDYDRIAAIVDLDSLVVVAKKAGFQVEDFIELVRNDRSFYQAFRNLRFVNYNANNSMIFFDKKGKERAAYESQTLQKAQGLCRTMQVMEELATGNFYKRKRHEYRYYTAKMYDKIFFTHGQICEQSRQPSPNEQAKGIDKHINELKKLIFQPGEKVDVPLIGGKTAVFDEALQDYYDYSIQSKTFQNGEACYVFVAAVKPAFETKKEGKTIIKYLETYFEKKTFQVIGRMYQLKYKGPLFKFDVKMQIALTKVSGQYVPKTITYDGMWDIAFKKAEKGTFRAEFFDFNLARE